MAGPRLAAIFLLLTIVGAVDAGTSPADPVAASGKGFEIRRGELDEVILDYQMSLVAQGETFDENQRPLVRSNLLQTLIQTKILMGKAAPDETARADEMAGKYIAAAQKQFGGNEAFDLQLRAKGLSRAQFRGRVFQQYACELVLHREFKSKIVAPERAGRFSGAVVPEPALPGEIRIGQILLFTVDPSTGKPLPDEQQALKAKLMEDLKSRADKGEDFAVLAARYSEDPRVKATGGQMDLFRGEMPAEFETEAFSLETNQVSRVVKTACGFHLIKRLPGGASAALPRADQTLIEKEFETQLPLYIDRIEKEANVRIFQ